MTAAGIVLILVGRQDERAHAGGSGTTERLADLGVQPRAIATGRGFTTNDVRTRVRGTWHADDVDQYLVGTSRPDWEFVQAFAEVVGGSKWHRADIERQIRPLWMAASSRPPSAAPGQVNRAARGAIVGIAAAAVLAAVGVMRAGLLSPHAQLQASGPVCSQVPAGLGAQSSPSSAAAPASESTPSSQPEAPPVTPEATRQDPDSDNHAGVAGVAYSHTGPMLASGDPAFCRPGVSCQLIRCCCHGQPAGITMTA